MKKIFLLLLVTIGTFPAFAQSADSDGDGVPDNKDLCPSAAGPAANNGCPEKKASANISQSAPVTTPAKCFPSGTSLVDAAIGKDGTYARVTTVRGMFKYFDTRTGQLVAASTAFNREFEDQYIPKAPAPPVNFELKITDRPGTGPAFPDKTFIVRQTGGEVVATYETTGQIFYEFDATVGALFVMVQKGKNYPTMLIRPHQEAKRIYKDGFIISSYHVLSPNRRYLVMDRGAIIDLEEGSIAEYSDDHAQRSKQVYIGFIGGSGEFFMADDKDGIIIYSCESGRRLRTISIPASLPRIQGFTVVPATNGKEFLYYMNFNNLAAAGLAYWVHDGAGTSLCDPSWQDEQSENWLTLIREAGKRLELEAAEAAEAEKKRAASGNEMGRVLVAQAEYRRKMAEEAAKPGKSNGASSYIRCSACNGTGTVMQQNVSYTKTTREYSSGAGSGSINYRVTSTPVYSNYAQPTVCRECGGSGRRRR